jgi:ketosteroid isomerase-like protein
MAEHPNVELFRRGYSAFQAGDLDTVKSLFDPDIVWNFPGHNRYSGPHRGADAVINLFLQQFNETNGTFRVELHDVLANDEHGVALATVSGEREGRRLSDRYTHVVHMKDGKLTESWVFGENQDEVDAFWG